MHGLTRRWLVESCAGLSSRPPEGPASLFDRVLRARGLVDPADIRRFCDPKLNDLSRPRDLPQATEAADRLVAAVRARERIVIYGDYDVDGITATAILWHILRCVAPDLPVRCYVPHRLEEGYGLNTDALRQLRADGGSLVVSVDCGVTAIEPVRAGRAAGLDFIITDHHAPAPDGALPDAIVVHPGVGAGAPFRDLCGAGVAFKLAWRFAQRFSGTGEEDAERLPKTLQQRLVDMLPLAALGTIADVVPLVGENRTLVRHGLAVLPCSTLPGVRALVAAAADAGSGRPAGRALSAGHVDAEVVAFRLAPMLNAIGRLGHAADAVHLLTGATPGEAAETAARLVRLNEQRKSTERRIFEEASARAEALGMTGPDHRAIVLDDPSWHPGVVGIVCARLAERYGRPAILLRREGGLCRGSGRSVDGFSLHGALCACRDLLTRFGGHDAAAGLEIPASALPDFTRAFIEHANGMIAETDLMPSVRLDCDATLDELHIASGQVDRLHALAPFGRSNRRPAVRIRAAVVEHPPRLLKGGGTGLRFRVRAGTDPAGAASLDAVWWNGARFEPQVQRGVRLDLAVEPKISTWNGRRTVELNILDVCPAPPGAARA